MHNSYIYSFKLLNSYNIPVSSLDLVYKDIMIKTDVASVLGNLLDYRGEKKPHKIILIVRWLETEMSSMMWEDRYSVMEENDSFY